MSGKRQYLSALENGYEEMETQKKNIKDKEKLNNKGEDHFPMPKEGLTIAPLSVVREDGPPSSLVAPSTNDSGTLLTVKKQNGNEVF